MWNMPVYIVLCIVFDVGRRCVCVHVERAGWPDFLVHVYKYILRKTGRKGRFVDVERAGGPDGFMQVHMRMYMFLYGAHRERRKNTLRSLMSSAALHPMASLTDSECERLDAIIRAVGNRLDRQLRKNGEDPDEGDIFECATAAVVAYVDDRAEDNIFRPVAKAKAGPARGTKRALG